MTYLEKYKLDHPLGLINNTGLPGGMVCHCPSNYDYEDVGNYLGCPHKGIDCRTCWNREMPEEPEKTKYIRIAVDEDTYSDIVNGAETTHIVVGPEDIVEAEPISQNPDILNITIHINEIDVYDPDEIISNVFKQVSQIKDRTINITIM